MAHLHRIGMLLLGGFVFVFGLVGLTWRPEVFSTHGPVVFGMTTNGFLAFLSMVVGFMLVFAAVFGGPVAAYGAIAAGSAFILSGVVNVFLLGTSLNIMAFSFSNVVFSWVVGAGLVVVGIIGRREHPTADSLYGPHAGTGEIEQAHPDPVAAAELAEAERARALHYATAEQLERLHEADRYRDPGDRVHAWEESKDHHHETPSA
jgi:hypothetical protein